MKATRRLRAAPIEEEFRMKEDQEKHSAKECPAREEQAPASCSCCAASDRLSWMRRKEYGKNGPASSANGTALHANRAAVLINNLLACPKTESRSNVSLGGDERFE